MHTAPLLASTPRERRFTIPRARSPGFGSYHSDFKALITPSPSYTAGTCFRYSFRFATKINSLARYSKRTSQLRRAVTHYGYKVSGALNSLLRVLFNVRSRYLFAIGLEEYLQLDVDATHIPDSYPGTGTRDTVSVLFSYQYGTITLYRAPFQKTSHSQIRYISQSTHHIFS